MANSFGRIAEAEQTKWLPFYYALLFTVQGSFVQADLSQVDLLCDQATRYLDQADKLTPNNSALTHFVLLTR